MADKDLEIERCGLLWHYNIICGKEITSLQNNRKHWWLAKQLPIVSDYVALLVYNLHVQRDKIIPNTNSEQLEPYE